MFGFKGTARGFAALCVVGAVFLYSIGMTAQGNLMLFLGFVAFVLSLLSGKSRRRRRR